jgi:hypothetical protein
VRPIVIEKKTHDGEVEDKLRRFKPVNCLFTVSQTEGDELPPVEPRGWDKQRALTTLDIRQVPYELIDGNTQDYSYKRDFAINPVAVNPTHTSFTNWATSCLGTRHRTSKHRRNTCCIAEARSSKQRPPRTSR